MQLLKNLYNIAYFKIIKIRKLDPQNEKDITIFMKIRKESIIDNENVYNLMPRLDEEADFSLNDVKI